MRSPNGDDARPKTGRLDADAVRFSPLLEPGAAVRFTSGQITQFVEELEVPFDLSIIEWRVTNTSKNNGSLRGQVIPYADQRAYTDRLNVLFTPAGWTRKYTVHTSANFQRRSDQKLVAKVFVTCEVLIFGIGSHSATGESWTDDDNAVTTAEAQAFKRACSCFGLGRYLYYYSGSWVNLDERKRPLATPSLSGWATPEGWRKGLRPVRAENRLLNTDQSLRTPSQAPANRKRTLKRGEQDELIRQIEAMAEALGKNLYRGILKAVARVWSPTEIHQPALLKKVMATMESADQSFERLRAAVEQTGPERLDRILRSLGLDSVHHINSPETLHDLVVRLEARSECDAGS